MANGYFNFLPPKDQWTSSTPDIGNINFLDNYIPPYQITRGDLYPLQIDNTTGLATNLIGSTGPVGCTGGSSGNPAATPFIMSVYAQVANRGDGASNGSGIIQMILLSNYDEGVIEGNKWAYYFASTRDLTNYVNAAQVYYSITPQNDGRVSIKFFDAKLINRNPTTPVSSYELQSLVYGPFSGNFNTFASWPYNNQVQLSGYINDYYYDPHFTRPNFQFNELNNTLNVNLKSGKLYHPYNIYMEYDDGTNNEYSDYTKSSGYVPGYPLNINYIYTPIIPGLEIISSGFDTTPNRDGITWPGDFSLNLYNFTSSNISSRNIYIDYTSEMGLIDKFQADTGVLPCLCSNNNECDNSNSSYWNNNCSTIQAGIAQYLVYQFIPISQIVPPSTNIITDYTKTYLNDNVTLPPGISFTPSAYVNGPTGTYPVQLQTLYDGNTGNTGVASNNIIESWMASPVSGQYICSGINQNNSYCGFTDYYDSLFAISYDYGTCGATGTSTNPFQKGQCSQDNSQICVPNFKYLQNLDQYTNPPYICVPATTGISTSNLESYITSIPIGNTNDASLSYPQYETTKLSNQTPNYGTTKDSGTNYIFLIIAGILAIILLIVIIYLIIKISKSSKNQNFNPSDYRKI
jgi:hypothetical protein